MPVLLPLAPLAEKWCPVGWKRVISMDWTFSLAACIQSALHMYGLSGFSIYIYIYNLTKTTSAVHMYALFGFPFKWFDMCIFVQFLSKNIYIRKIHYHIHVCITVYTFAHVKYLTAFSKWSHRMSPDRHRCSMDWLLLLLLHSVRCFVHLYSEFVHWICTVNIFIYVQCALHCTVNLHSAVQFHCAVHRKV